MTNETGSNQVDASTSAYAEDKEAVLAYLNERGKQREGCHQLAELVQRIRWNEDHPEYAAMMTSIDELAGKMRALVQNMAEEVTARTKGAEDSASALVAAAQTEAAKAKAELEQAQKQVEAYRKRDADLVAYIEESWAFQEHLMEMLDDTKERLAAAQKEAEDPEAGAARLIKLAEILTSDRNSSGNSEQE